MPGTVYYAATSLDGYIAEPEEKLEWLTGFDGPGATAEGARPMEGAYERFFAGIGALVMGSKTYEFLLREEIWPYGDMPAWVYTRRELPRIESAGGLRFARGDVAGLHAEMLAAAGDRDLWLLGGGELASQFVAAGLLDRISLTVVPLVLGAGLPLFAGAVPPLRLSAVTPFDNGMVQLDYELDR